MSASGDRDATPEGQEGPVSRAGAWAGADDGVGGHSGPHYGGVMAPVVEAAGVARSAGGLGEEEGGQAAAMAVAGAPEVRIAEEDSDIGPAEEEAEENVPLVGLDRVVDARHFPMAGFRFMFLDLVHSLLHRIYYNHHILTRPRGRHLLVAHRRPTTNRDGGDGGSEDVPVVLQVPERPRARVAALEGEGLGEGFGQGPDVLPAGAAGGGPEQPGEPAGGAAAQVEAAQEIIVTAHEVTRYQYENWEDEDTIDYLGGGEKEAAEENENENKEEEGPPMDVDPGEVKPTKSRYLCIPLSIARLFLAFTSY
nr:cancer/testis antigen 47A-like isoform X1 [Microcebus murinus]